MNTAIIITIMMAILLGVMMGSFLTIAIFYRPVGEIVASDRMGAYIIPNKSYDKIFDGRKWAIFKISRQ